MKITVQSIHFTADKNLLAFVEKKTQKLDQIFDHITSAEVYLRLDNSEDEQNKITEIKLNVPGVQMFAKEQCKSFEEAADLAIESLRRQLDKYKTKQKSVKSASLPVENE